MPVFYNNKSNDSLQKEGYVIVSLLEETELNLLENFFYSPDNKEFHEKFTTYACNDSDYKKRVDSILKEIIGNKLKSIITEDMIPFWGNFMMKIPSENSNMPLHTDWQYVDEKKHVSLNVWTPFTDTNLENGALHVVPKSHLSCNYPRGINLPRYYEINEAETKRKFGKALFLKKGEAVIYDHRLLHYSFPNKSDKNRLAATLVYIPKETAVSIFHKDNSTQKTQIFEIENVANLIDSDFYNEPKNFKNKTFAKIPEMNEIKVFADLEKQIRKNTDFLSVLKSFFRI
jgi:hypothetical protein